MQRWALTLAAHEYQINHRPGLSIPLIRLPVANAPTRIPVPADTIMTMQYMDMFPVTASDIPREKDRYLVLSQVFLRTRDGFQRHEDNEQLKPYIQRKDELSIRDGCLMWGIRVIVPSRFRHVLLDELHNAHSGIVRMKAVGRSLMWWPGIDLDIEQRVRRSCPKPSEAPLQPWSFPQDHVWER